MHVTADLIAGDAFNMNFVIDLHFKCKFYDLKTPSESLTYMKSIVEHETENSADEIKE